MKRLTIGLGLLALAAVLSLTSFLPGRSGTVHAGANGQLCLALDGSGSITPPDFALMTSGVAAAIESIPSSLQPGKIVEVSVVLFSDAVTKVVPPTDIDNQAIADTVAATVAGLTQPGGGTAIGDAIKACTAQITGSAKFGTTERQAINIVTDGVNSSGQAPGDAADFAVGAGINRIDAAAVGLADITELLNTVRPQPGREITDTADLVNLRIDDQGFVVNVGGFAEFLEAFRDKVRAVAGTIGDPHLYTFGGLFYDFQATGDFVLANVDPDFVVQARQVSGAPDWPDASVNAAVATRMGTTEVALCREPTRLYVDGAETPLGDGGNISAPGGVDVSRSGDVYVITSPSGDTVRAEVRPAAIDAYVALGVSAGTVTGLLANADHDVNKIAASDGTVFTQPFSFDDLYQHFGESWRVPSNESLLSVCGAQTEDGNPGQPFFAEDLDPTTYQSARAVCLAAGVEGEAFLDACTLDVAFFGDDTAADVFVGLRQPVAVAESAPPAVGGVSLDTDLGGAGGSGLSMLAWLVLGVICSTVAGSSVWYATRRWQRR